MLGDDMTTFFMAGIILLWLGLVICFRRKIFARPDPLAAPPSEPSPDAPGPRGPARHGYLDGPLVAGITFAVVGYILMSYAIFFWDVGLGAAMYIIGFVAVPAVLLRRTMRR